MIPDSSVNEVTGWQAEILPIHEWTVLCDAKKGLGFVNITSIPVQVQRFPGGSGSQISRQSGGKVFSLTHRPPLLAIISVRG